MLCITVKIVTDSVLYQIIWYNESSIFTRGETVIRKQSPHSDEPLGEGGEVGQFVKSYFIIIIF